MESQQSSTAKFEWLADLQKSQCFTTCDWANPAKSIDFGSNGFTASVTDWHELLQLTAPDEKCGVVYVKGWFPNTPDAILARAQTREDTGSKGTFDIHFQPKSPPNGSTFATAPVGYILGEKRAQGLANFRWPYMQYELERREGEEVRKGGYEGISFVKDGTMFQIIRLTAEQTPKRKDSWGAQSIKFRLGGKIQWGCPCSNGITQSPTRDFEFEVLDDGYRLAYNSKNKDSNHRLEYNHRLEIQAFENDEPKLITKCDKTPATGVIKVTLSQSPTIIVTTYTLRALPKTHKRSDTYPMIRMVDSTEIEKYLGISTTSPEMTDKLWLASLTKQFDAVETLEICAVARYVEQILGVSSIPINSGNTEHSLDLDPAAGPDFESIPGIALIRNIMTSQFVELESTFWQVRFLVKAYNFLATRPFKENLLKKDEIIYLGRVRDAYLSRIRNHIQLALVWMMKAEVKRGKILLPTRPETASTGEYLNNHSAGQRIVAVDDSYTQACFTRISVWYVSKYCKKAFTPSLQSFIQSHILKNESLPKLRKDNETKGVEKEILLASNESAPREKKPPVVEKESTPKNDVLLWFDMSCLLLLWQDWYPEVDSPELQNILGAQELREKIAKRLRKKQSGPYSMEDEEMDRLFLLGEELGLQNPSGTTAVLATARAEQTRGRIASRRPTEMFNCGPRLGTIRRSPRLISNAPWELALLNHHTLLQTSLHTADESSINQNRDACFQFFLSDYTFMVSWDRADKSMIGKWWDIEPGAIICSTLLDKIEKSVKSNPALLTRPTLSQSQQLEQPSTTAAPPGRGFEDAFRDFLAKLETKQDSYQIGRGDRFISRDFDWRTCRPSRIYHLKSWVQSLDDTPEIFYSKHASFPPQRIIKYLMNGKDEEYNHPRYSKHTVRDKITADDVPFLSTFDFKLKDDFTFINESITLQKKTRDEHHKALLDSLNDCLVDQDTKYRIFVAEKCCPEVVRAFAYVWHPDALDTFDNYFGTTSQFADTKDTLWTSSITLSHWKLLESGQLIDKSDRFYEDELGAGRKDGEFPPTTVSPSWRILEERSSSLVITGDVNGYNWICSIWTSLTDTATIKADIDRLPKILHLFIHKQAIGRCLVFLIILGHICGKLADEYNEIVAHLDKVVQLGEEALFRGLEWEPRESIDRLKRMIWGGQALRIFDDRLSASLSQIRNAKEALDHNIKQDEGQQHLELLQEYMTVFEGFEKHFSNLSNVQIRIQLKINHVIGLRDGISTVANVEDSRTALEDSKRALEDSKTNIELSNTTIKQGNNIRVLTLLTIVYLPLGYVTGLFSENHGILPNSAGKDLYAGLVVLFTVVTYGLAWRLDKIQDFLMTKGETSNQNKLDLLTGNAGPNDPGRNEEDTPVSSRETTNESASVSKKRPNPPSSSRGWRLAGRRRRKRDVHDEEVPLELVSAG